MKGQSKSRGDPDVIATAPDSTAEAEPVQTEDQQNQAAAQAVAERRQKMIEDCEQNNGVDCEREVDTELGARSDPASRSRDPPDAVGRAEALSLLYISRRPPASVSSMYRRHTFDLTPASDITFRSRRHFAWQIGQTLHRARRKAFACR